MKNATSTDNLITIHNESRKNIKSESKDSESKDQETTETNDQEIKDQETKDQESDNPETKDQETKDQESDNPETKDQEIKDQESDNPETKDQETVIKPTSAKQKKFRLKSRLEMNTVLNYTVEDDFDDENVKRYIKDWNDLIIKQKNHLNQCKYSQLFLIRLLMVQMTLQIVLDHLQLYL